jgi:hypothetical protein
VISYFSVHDFKGTKPEIAHIDATGHDKQENDFGGKQHGVVIKGNVHMKPHARL